MRLASILILLSGVSRKTFANVQNDTIIFLIVQIKWRIHYFELADDEIFVQLQDVRTFVKWNGTSLRNLFVAASGYNGKKVRIQAINLLLNFVMRYKDSHRMRLCMRPPWIIPERCEDIQFLGKKKRSSFFSKNTQSKITTRSRGKIIKKNLDCWINFTNWCESKKR